MAGCFGRCVISIFWLHYSNQMMKGKKRSVPSPCKSGEKVKTSTMNQSTRIHQSHSTTLDHHRPSPSPAFPATKFHPCCSPLQNHQPAFRPAIAPLPFELYPQQGLLSRSRQEQWEALTQDTRQRGMQRSELKVQEEEDKLKECTFAPTITPFDHLAPSTHSVHAKLYEEAEARRQAQVQSQKEELERQRAELQELQKKQPDASRWKLLNSERFDLEPLYKRLEKVIEEKRRNKKMVAEKEEATHPFRPELTETTRKIAAGRKGMVESVVDRLIEDFAKREGRINLLREGRQANLKKQCTFAPAVNNYLPTDAVRPAKERKQLHDDYLFTPAINPLSALMTQDRSNETAEERFFRMIQTPTIRRADRIVAIEAEVYAECCFNPEINEISRQIHGCGQKHHACEAKKPQSPTHRPSINHASRIMSQAKRAKSLETVRQKNRAREQAYRQQMEYSKMRECTVRPKIKDNKEARTASNTQMTLHEVAGFQGFYENREKYNEKERARKALEERLFQLEKSYDARMGRTKITAKNI